MISDDDCTRIYRLYTCIVLYIGPTFHQNHLANSPINYYRFAELICFSYVFRVSELLCIAHSDRWRDHRPGGNHSCGSRCIALAHVDSDRGYRRIGFRDIRSTRRRRARHRWWNEIAQRYCAVRRIPRLRIRKFIVGDATAELGKSTYAKNEIVNCHYDSEFITAIKTSPAIARLNNLLIVFV